MDCTKWQRQDSNPDLARQSPALCRLEGKRDYTHYTHVVICILSLQRDGRIQGLWTITSHTPPPPVFSREGQGQVYRVPPPHHWASTTIIKPMVSLGGRHRHRHSPKPEDGPGITCPARQTRLCCTTKDSKISAL